MEIKDYTEKTCFKDIEIGDCFLAFTGRNKDLFMKIETIEIYNKRWAAVRIKDGALWPFEDYNTIKKVKAVLAYKEV